MTEKSKKIAELEKTYTKFLLWLDSLEANTKFTRPVSDTLANHVRQWWYTLETVCSMNVPIAGQLESEVGFYFVWSYEHGLLEVEIYPDGVLWWWATNRKNNWQAGSHEIDYILSYDLERWIRKIVFKEL